MSKPKHTGRGPLRIANRVLAVALVLLLAVFLSFTWHRQNCLPQSAAGEKVITIIEPGDDRVIERFFGRALREKVATDSNVAFEVVRALQGRPGHKRALVVVAGSAVHRIGSTDGCQKLLLLNPEQPPKEILSRLEQVPSVKVYWGDMHYSGHRIFWEFYCPGKDNFSFTTRIGVDSEFIGWMELSLEHL